MPESEKKENLDTYFLKRGDSFSKKMDAQLESKRLNRVRRYGSEKPRPMFSSMAKNEI